MKRFGWCVHCRYIGLLLQCSEPLNTVDTDCTGLIQPSLLTHTYDKLTVQEEQALLTDL